MADVTMGPGGPTEKGLGTTYPPGGGIGEKAMGTTGIERRMDEMKGRPFEGEVTRRIEFQTGKVPSMAYLVAAGASVIGSLTLFALRRPLSAIFVGLWSPTFLLLGNYNKMVKLGEELKGSQQSFSGSMTY